MSDWIGWAILLPWLTTMLLMLAKFSAYLNEDHAEKIIKTVTSLILALLSVYLLLLTLQHIFYDSSQQITLGQWLKSADFSISISFLLDLNGLISSLFFTVILAILLWFAPLSTNKHYIPYYLLYNLFSSALLLLLLSDQWFLTLIAWEISAISVYLLLYDKHANQVLISKQSSVFYLGRLSSIFMLIALLLASHWLKIDHWHQLDKALVNLSLLQTILLLSFFLLAIFIRLLSFSCVLRHLSLGTDHLNTKSTSKINTIQMPAMIILALMVFSLLSTLYILIRLAPLFQQAVLVQSIVAILSLGLTVAAGLQALVSSDQIRRVLLQSLTHSGLILLLYSLNFFLLALIYLLLYSLVLTWQIIMLQPHKIASPPQWLQKSKGLHIALLRGFLPARFPNCD